MISPERPQHTIKAEALPPHDTQHLALCASMVQATHGSAEHGHLLCDGDARRPGMKMYKVLKDAQHQPHICHVHGMNTLGVPQRACIPGPPLITQNKQPQKHLCHIVQAPSPFTREGAEDLIQTKTCKANTNHASQRCPSSLQMLLTTCVRTVAAPASHTCNASSLL